MSRACVYILNQNPIYRGMFSVSVRMLRKHNPSIPIILLYIQDAGLDNYKLPSNLAKHIGRDAAKKYMMIEEQEIFDLCKNLHIELRCLPSPCHLLNRYSSAHRVYLKEIQEESVLLLDTDTFIFENIDSLFDKQSDFVADRMRGYFVSTKDKPPHTEQTSWLVTFKNGLENIKVKMSPFNSGVVVFHKGKAALYGEQVGDYCNQLLLKKHPFADVMYAHREDARNREECACTLFVLENKLTWEYFDKSEVQTHTSEFPTKIFHSTSPAWPYYFDMFGNQGLLMENG